MVLVGLAVALAASFVPLAARALDTVSFTLPEDAPASLTDTLRAGSLVQSQASRGGASAQDVVAAARADYGRLTGVLYAQGYYGGIISILLDGREAASLSPLETIARVERVDIRVDPGPLFRFGIARITPLARETRLPGGFAPGGVAASTLVEAATAAAISGWRDAGYAKARVTAQSFQADHGRAVLDADIGLDPGRQLRFGALHLDGQSNVREARLRKIASLPEGEVFSPDSLDAVAARLRRTGTFSSVRLREAEVANPDGTLDVRLSVVDQKPRRYGLGAEYSTLEGATLSGFWLHRNFLGGAERFRVDGEISGIGGETGGTDLSFGARYQRPATPGPDTSLFVELAAERMDEPDYLSTQYGFALGLHRIFSDELEVEIALEWEHFRVEDAVGVRDFEVLSLPLSATWDRRDDALDPTAGHFLHAEIRPFMGSGDTSSGLRFYGDGRVYRSLSDRLVLAGRLQIGAVTGPSVANAPPDYLFYSGGGGTVRGQSYQSLGIDLPTGRRRGGRSFLGLSAEARFAMNERFGIVGFADAGYVGTSAFYDGQGSWHSGAGLGLRYKTDFGPLRLDVAVPVSGGGSGAQLYVGIGQAF